MLDLYVDIINIAILFKLRLWLNEVYAFAINGEYAVDVINAAKVQHITAILKLQPMWKADNGKVLVLEELAKLHVGAAQNIITIVILNIFIDKPLLVSFKYALVHYNQVLVKWRENTVKMHAVLVMIEYILHHKQTLES